MKRINVEFCRDPPATRVKKRFPPCSLCCQVSSSFFCSRITLVQPGQVH